MGHHTILNIDELSEENFEKEVRIIGQVGTVDTINVDSKKSRFRFQMKFRNSEIWVESESENFPDNRHHKTFQVFGTLELLR
jgi:hypothetical protein